MLNPFDPESQPLLEGIQGNILKAHGRPHTANLFIRCADSDNGVIKQQVQNEAKKWLKSLVDDSVVQSAYAQLRANILFKESGSRINTGLFACIHISAAGYDYLFGAGTNETFGDTAFKAGMKARKSNLDDPDVNTWDKDLQETAHFMLLLAHTDSATLNKAINEAVSNIQVFGRITAIERGEALFNSEGAGIEHFGYVDGVSQPLFFEDEWETYKRDNGIINEATDTHFDPRASTELVLVRDPLVPERAYGSYFVFRKLEQNVKGFKQAEADLAITLGLKAEDRERAGAMLVGRFEDGTPVQVRHEGELIHNAVFNNFGYNSPADNSRCPFHAHIRKTNPRIGPVEEGEQVKKNLVMARRGIPFGTRLDDPNDGQMYNKPEGGVGLLFMSYQASIEQQFEAIQRSANDTKNGIDPIIGQGDHTVVGDVTKEWGKPGSAVPVSFDLFVHLKGGEYFFAPSMWFLRNVYK